MGFLVRTLKLLIILLLLVAVVLWFAARRGDRGYISKEVTIDRPAATVYRWITTDELLRRWISDLTKLERIPSTGGVSSSNVVYRIDEMIANRPVSIKVRIVRAIQNQDLQLSIRSANERGEGFSSEAEFKLLPNADYTQFGIYSANELPKPERSDVRADSYLPDAKEIRRRPDAAEIHGRSRSLSRLSWNRATTSFPRFPPRPFHRRCTW